MSLKYGKTQVAAMAEVLDGKYDSVTEAAEAALAEAEAIFESRAKFVVVGQLMGTRERHWIPAEDPEAIKLSLGWYSTEGDARSAAESLWSSSATGDLFRSWVLNVHHGTPADFHAKQKAKYVELEAKQKQAKHDRLQDQIAKRMADDAARALSGKGNCVCSHPQYEHSRVGVGSGKCWIADCGCPKWSEKK